MITIELYELKNLCKDMAELGAANYAKILSPAKDNISQRESYREFGEARVKDWIRRGLVSIVRNGTAKNSKLLYSRSELMSICQAEKLNFLINK